MAPDRRKGLAPLLRELARSEARAIEHGAREARRIGEAPPVLALRAVALHAVAMQPRFAAALVGHELAAGAAAVPAGLRFRLRDRLRRAERAYRDALDELRHGVDVAGVLREVARREEIFALIRWCDDWLGARRTLVARVAAQLGWFVRNPELPPPPPPPPADPTQPAAGTREQGGHGPDTSAVHDSR